MKMTDADERALAAIEDAIRTSSYGAFAPGRTALIEARDHIRARLAAGQQKGGGELCPDCGDRVDPNPDENGETRCADCWITHRRATSPQPSIPAPAQQEVDVDRLRALIANWQTPPTRAGESWITAQARQACAHQLAAALACPPHADQETQG